DLPRATASKQDQQGLAYVSEVHRSTRNAVASRSLIVVNEDAAPAFNVPSSTNNGSPPELPVTYLSRVRWSIQFSIQRYLHRCYHGTNGE
ncbi:hypothetical protein, partial [Mycobacterium sp.]|uniref:hypothetical protein n=1 Tax=Mycobacterium sp. TaxID=1785 RepID=UPI003C71E65E